MRFARSIKLASAAVVVGALTASCAGFRAEVNGRDTGRNICDVKKADNPNDLARQLRQLNRDLDRAQRTIGRPVREDVRDIQENLSDLAEHVRDGQSALSQQDVAVIRRNVQTLANQAPDLTKRYYQGVVEGLGNCV